MKKHSLSGFPQIAMVALLLIAIPAQNVFAVGLEVFINEIHYDNTGTDTGEAVEIAGPAGTDLSGWTLVLYNGSNGTSYNTINLSTVLTNQQGGYGTYVVNLPTNGLQNGSPDGLALVRPGNIVDQFLSYEGSFTATDGPAVGIMSTDIGVAESGSEPAGESLQLAGTGSFYEDFSWSVPATNTFGAPNAGQTFLAAGPADPVINEIMQNPAAVADSSGEWFELYNPGGVDIDINGWTIEDDGADSHVINNGGPLMLPAGGYLVLGNNGDSGTNGGVTVDYVYSSWFLANGDDEVVLLDGSQLEIDRVNYDGGPLFPDPTGASMSLTDPALDNNVGANWCEATTSFGAGDRGTPGAANDCGGSSEPGLLLTELVVTPTAGEFIEIHNPGASPIDLSDVYITDATFAGGSTYYYNIVTGTNAGGGGFSDFLARFPDGASIAPGAYQTISLAGSDGFFAEYGINPDYELFEDGVGPDAIPDMREGLPGSINGQGGLTNGGEVAILFTWDGQSDLVADLDYTMWGDNAEAVDKTGVSIDGPDGDLVATQYLEI